MNSRAVLRDFLFVLVLFCLPGFVFAQEQAHDWQFQQDVIGDLSESHLYIRDIGCSPTQNRFYYTTKEIYTHYIAGQTRIDIKLNRIGANNIIENQYLDYDLTEPDQYNNFVIHASDFLAFPILSGNSFHWKYDEDSQSAPLILPGTSYSILSIHQDASTNCLILFKNLSNNQAEAYYVNTAAALIWNCSFDLNTLLNGNTFHKAILLDASHFVIGIFHDDGLYDFITLNNQGSITANCLINAGTNPWLETTKIPGRLILTAFFGLNLAYYYYEDNEPNLINVILVANNTNQLPAVADSSGVVVAVYHPGNLLKLVKTDWEGNLLWEHVLASSWNRLSDFSPSWMKISVTGCIYICYKTLEWQVINVNTITGDTYGWREHYRLVKVLPNGVCTDVNDDLIPQPQSKISAYPNPFTDILRIEYLAEHKSIVRVAVYDIKGRLVKHITDKTDRFSTSEWSWNGLDASGRKAAPGVYILRIEDSQIQYSSKVVKLM